MAGTMRSFSLSYVRLMRIRTDSGEEEPREMEKGSAPCGVVRARERVGQQPLFCIGTNSLVAPFTDYS